MTDGAVRIERESVIRINLPNLRVHDVDGRVNGIINVEVENNGKAGILPYDVYVYADVLRSSSGAVLDRLDSTATFQRFRVAGDLRVHWVP